MLAVACVGSTLPVYLTAAWTWVFTLMSALAYLPEVPIYWPIAAHYHVPCMFACYAVPVGPSIIASTLL